MIAQASACCVVDETTARLPIARQVLAFVQPEFFECCCESVGWVTDVAGSAIKFDASDQLLKLHRPLVLPLR